MAHVSELIREARVGMRLTQVQLAEVAGTSQPAIARYEAGTEMPTIPTLERILRACGRTLKLESSASSPESFSGVRGLIGANATLLRKQRRKLLDAATEHGVSNVRVFGSVATGRARSDSDVDFLVDLDEGRSLLDLVAFKHEAEKILGVPVDAATVDVLKPRSRKSALMDAVQL